MRVQYGKSFRIVQYLALVIIVLPLNLGAQLFEGLIDFGLEVIKAVDDELLEITALSDAEENRIGREIKKEILKKEKAVKTHPKDINPYLALETLLPHCSRKGIDYDLTIVQDETFNAYTVAGGKIFIYIGLLERLRSQEELVFVVAHELAHNELKHCVKKIQHSVYASDIEPILGNIVQLGYRVYKRPYSKSEEREADEYAINLMRKAGYSKQGGISFFRLLESMEGKREDDIFDDINDLISTHPSPRERRERIERM